MGLSVEVMLDLIFYFQEHLVGVNVDLLPNSVVDLVVLASAFVDQLLQEESHFDVAVVNWLFFVTLLFLIIV